VSPRHSLKTPPHKDPRGPGCDRSFPRFSSERTHSCPHPSPPRARSPPPSPFFVHSSFPSPDQLVLWPNRYPRFNPPVTVPRPPPPPLFTPNRPLPPYPPSSRPTLSFALWPHESRAPPLSPPSCSTARRRSGLLLHKTPCFRFYRR